MSCIVEIIANVNEESSISFGFSLTGKDDEAVTPNTFNWILSNIKGVVVNDRSAESETPAVTNWVDLEGDDLVFPAGGSGIRVVTIYGTMDTTRDSVVQVNQPYTHYIKFNICDIPKIPIPVI